MTYPAHEPPPPVDPGSGPYQQVPPGYPPYPSQPGYGTPPPEYGTTQPGYGPPQPGYGTPPEYGTQQAGYGTTTPGYGTTPPEYGTQQAGYGAPPPGYGTTPPYYYPNPYGYVPPRQQEGLAIASLVVSCAAVIGLCTPGFGGVLGIVGAILGHVARARLKHNGRAGGGLALAGIIVGWALAAVSAVLLAVTMVIFIRGASGADATPI